VDGPPAARAAGARDQDRTRARTNDLGCTPTARELATQVGCTPEELLDASKAAYARSSDSLDRPATTPHGDAATLGERLGDEDPGFEAAEASATLDRLLNTLSERDQLVLRLRFRDDLTQTETARRIGCSQMHVSRIQRAALAQLVQNATTTPSEANAPEHDAGYEELWAQAAVA
jgi:RNA polymerase sigma-B factor